MSIRTEICNRGGVDISSDAPSTESHRLMDKKTTSVEVAEAPQPIAGNEQGHHSHDRGLLLIGLFKLGKALLFFCIGVGAIHLLHKDLGDELMKLATALKFDPESRIVTLMMEKVDLIDAHRLREIGFATFAYSALALTEGVGLLLEKVWAEYLTLILTISFLPWELWELARRPSLFRFLLLVINLLVLAYLVWLLQRKKQRVGGVVQSKA
jgi:uncharacterized membrane protein (DUF2068 family)